MGTPTSALRPPRKRRRAIQWGPILRKLFFWLFVLSFLATVVWTLFFSSVMKIEQININNRKVDKRQAESVIRGELSGKVFGVFPRDNLLFIPSGQIEQALEANFRLIKDVRVIRVFPKAVLIELAERDSVLVWCVEGSCYLIDEAGTVFYRLKPTDEEYTNMSLVRVEDKSHNNLEVGKQVLEQPRITFLLNLPGKVKDFAGLTVQNQFFTPSSMSGEIRAKLAEGGEVFFSLTDSMDNQISVLKKVVDEKIGRDKLSEVEYIDLRLRGKVVFKLKQREEQQESQDGDDPDKEGQPDGQATSGQKEEIKVKGEKKKKEEKKKEGG